MGFNFWMYGIIFVICVVLVVAALTDSAVLTILAGIGAFILYYVVIKSMLNLTDKGVKSLTRKLDEKFDKKYTKNYGGK